MVKPVHPMAGKLIKTGDCISCGKPVSVKANKNGIAYYFCRWPDPETGDPCNDQHRYPRKTSAKMIADATKPKDENNGPKRDNRDGGDAGKPEPETSFLGT